MVEPRPMYVRLSKVQPVFGIHRATAYRWAERGLIRIYKRGSMSWVKVEEMEAVIEGREA